MGDRTFVTITIHKDFLPSLIQLGGGTQDKLHQAVCYEDMQEYGDEISFSDSEVNYAEWSTLEELLQKGKIEYDKRWEQGGDYDAGEANYRCIKGKWVLQEIYKEQKAQIDLLELLLKSKDIEKAAKKTLKKLRPFKITDLQDGKCNAEKFIEKLSK